MDPDFLLVVIMVITVTAIVGGSVNGIVQKVLDYKRSKAGIVNGQPRSGKVGELSDRTDLIEDRLRVLERIATDRGQLLSDEIEQLRDEASRNLKLEKPES